MTPEALPLPAQAEQAKEAGVSMWALAGVVLATRGVAFFLTQNAYGDPFARISMGEHWVQHPHWISAFGDGAWQFGPLHLYLLGIASKLIPYREHAGRVVSLVAGVATTFPLWSLCNRLYGERAARMSCLLLAFWGLHIQFSTTAASEALSVLLFAAALAWFAAERWALSGLALTLAAATRYDVWMLIPLLAVVLAMRRAWVAAFVFSAVSLSFPIVWMYGNWRMHGSPQYPAAYINDFHRTWFAATEAASGFWKHRALNLVFWPFIAVLTLTPVVAAAGVFYARRPGWLVAVMVLPVVIFTVRSTIVGDFEPLARFTATSLFVLIVFAGQVVRWRAVALLATLTLALGAYTWRTEGGWTASFRTVSPVTTQSRDVMDAAAQARACAGVPLMPADPQYRDLAAGFYAGVPVKYERNGDKGDCLIHF
jgi:4-amino-4-deoxy-L-arabinose transferase-like glycosyltransferase